jgi:hypothetical protein
MKQSIRWSTVLALGFVLLAMPVSRAAAAEAEKGESAAKAAGYVGTVVAVTPESRTLVVDVPLRETVLRVGAEVTDTTRITANGQAVSLDRVQTGDRVRITVRRIETGNEAVSVEVLPGRSG